MAFDLNKWVGHRAASTEKLLPGLRAAIDHAIQSPDVTIGDTYKTQLSNSVDPEFVKDLAELKYFQS